MKVVQYHKKKLREPAQNPIPSVNHCATSPCLTPYWSDNDEIFWSITSNLLISRKVPYGIAGRSMRLISYVDPPHTISVKNKEIGNVQLSELKIGTFGAVALGAVDRTE